MAGWDDSIFGNLPGPSLPGSPYRPTPPPNTPMFPVNPAQVVGGLYDLGTDYAGQLAAWLASHPGSTPSMDQSGLARDLTAMMQSPIHGGFNPDTALNATLAAAPLAVAANTGRTAEEVATGAKGLTSIQSAEQAIKNSPDLMHRGMSEDEYQQILQSGAIQSKGTGNVGANEGGMTFFSGDPRVAASYAHLQGSPAYVVSVRRPDPSVLGIDRQSGFEIGANSPINADDITAVYRGERGPGGQYQWGNVPLGADAPKTAEEVATGVKAAPAAPAILTRANPTADDIAAIKASVASTGEKPWPTAQNPMFDTSPDALARNNDVVPQVSYRDQLPRPDPGATLPLAGRAQQIIDARAPLADKIASDLQPLTDPNNPFSRLTQFYSTSPILEQLQKQGVLDPDEAQQFMRDWAGQGAATSMRTKTPQNMRNSSYLLWRIAQGDPLTREAFDAEGNLPGFKMMGQHVDRSQQFATGAEDINQNPKPVMFREGWSGNQSDVTTDVHNIGSTLYNYDQLNPGQLHPSWFKGGEQGPAYQGYKAAGGFPTGKVLPDKTINDSLAGTTQNKIYKQTEYGPMTDPWYDAAEKLGVSPAAAQSGGWFNYGPITGLKSPPKILPDLLNDQLEHTSRVLGVSPQHILNWWGQRKIPLAQNSVPGMTLNSQVG